MRQHRLGGCTTLTREAERALWHKDFDSYRLFLLSEALAGKTLSYSNYQTTRSRLNALAAVIL